MERAQAAASLETLKVKDSPIKKLNFNAEDKENMPVAVEPVESLTQPESLLEKKPVEEVQEQPKQEVVAKTPKELEKEEPLLQENHHRFVLFPLKYHEIVRAVPDTRDYFLLA
jgi:ribonucleoside-diphosphate reductase subunit M2